MEYFFSQKQEECIKERKYKFESKYPVLTLSLRHKTDSKEYFFTLQNISNKIYNVTNDK